MTNQKIMEFNEKLVKNNIDIGIIDYVKIINEKYYNIDISFIDNFIDLINKDECCIPHEFLKTLGITQLTGGSSDVKKILNNNNGIENKDYMLQLSHTAENREQITYVLHPLIFKKILIRNKNTDKYANYYLLLEMCIKHYNDYHVLKLNKRIEEDNKIKLLLLNESETLDNFTIYKCDQDTLHVRKHPHQKGYISTKHNHNEYPYALINGSNKNVSKILKVCKIKVENKLIQIKCPSYNNFLKKIKEVMCDKFERKTTEYDDCIDDNDENVSRISVTRFFKIVDITEEDFITEINKIHNSRGS